MGGGLGGGAPTLAANTREPQQYRRDAREQRRVTLTKALFGLILVIGSLPHPSSPSTTSHPHTSSPHTKPALPEPTKPHDAAKPADNIQSKQETRCRASN